MGVLTARRPVTTGSSYLNLKCMSLYLSQFRPVRRVRRERKRAREGDRETEREAEKQRDGARKIEKTKEG